jgi:hypothetical protein
LKFFSSVALALAAVMPAAAQEAAPVACGKQAAQFAAGKVDLWVTRRGTLARDNPLRPLTPETIEVLQVVIRGKIATAYGPDLDSLHRGASPSSLQAQSGGAAIRWADGVDGLPATLRIHEDDSAGVLAALQFRACGDAPKAVEVKAPSPKSAEARRAAKPKPAPKPAELAPNATHTPGGFVLPQGAIP